MQYKIIRPCPHTGTHAHIQSLAGTCTLLQKELTEQTRSKGEESTALAWPLAANCLSRFEIELKQEMQHETIHQS